MAKPRIEWTGKKVCGIWTMYYMWCGMSIAIKIWMLKIQVGEGIWNFQEVSGANCQYALHVRTLSNDLELYVVPLNFLWCGAIWMSLDANIM